MSEKFMKLALEQAQIAFNAGEVPVGAVIVDSNGNIIASAYNQTEKLKTQTAHAEMLALQQAGQKIGDWRLKECTLYVTLEPCAMCMSAILLSRISKISFAAGSPLFGYRVDKQISFALYNCPVTIQEGILDKDASVLLRSFFRSRRRSSSG